MKILFWMSFAFIVYTYVGYPLLLALMAKFICRPVSRGVFAPSVSVVIAACNEERIIAKRLENLLIQDYPSEQYEIIVVSDGSTDRTNEIIVSYSDRNVLLVQLNDRGGKAEALNQGVARAAGDIVVFADARQTFALDALRQLVENFADPTVGCVSGELMFLDDADSRIQAEMGAYWHYEKAIRKSESATGSVVGATGAIYAIRRGLYHPLPSGIILDDVLTPMNIARKGKRVLFETRAVAHDIISKNGDQEWSRKVRTLAGNWQLLSLAPWIMLPWKNPLWWRYVSHKLLRLLVPLGLVLFFVANVLLPGSFFRLFALLQIAFYCIALVGFIIPATRSLRWVNLSYFFVLMNASAVAGFWKWATGGCATVWQPAYSGKESTRA